MLQDKVKSKGHPRTGHEGPEVEKRYSPTPSLTSTQYAVGWSTPRPGLFAPRKETRCPLYRRLGRPQGRSGQVRKTSPQPGFDPRTFQPVASRYTDWAIPANSFSALYVAYLNYVNIKFWYTILQKSYPIQTWTTLIFFQMKELQKFFQDVPDV